MLRARRWSDRLPVVGWLGLRRETRLHGTGFWVRPMLIELLAGLGLAGLYWWEVRLEALLPEPLISQLAQRGAMVQRQAAIATLHLVFIAHAFLIGFMIVASLIDVDERLIPDEVTVPGTLLGLFLAAVLPWSLLPIMHRAPLMGLGLGSPELRFLMFTSSDCVAAVDRRTERVGRRTRLRLAMVRRLDAAHLANEARISPGLVDFLGSIVSRPAYALVARDRIGRFDRRRGRVANRRRALARAVVVADRNGGRRRLDVAGANHRQSGAGP